MRFLRKKKKAITALQIDSHWLKIVQVELFTGREKRVTRIAIKEISSLSDDAIAKTISDLSRELKIDSRFLIISIPRHFATTRNLELPSTNPAEIRDMIELQIGKHTPYTRDEVISDYQMQDSSAEGYSRVMLVIVRRDIVERYLKILEGAGLKSERISLSSEGLLNWLCFAYKQGDVDRPYALIDVDYDISDFEVILKDKLIFSRNISGGFLQSIGKMDQWQRKFIEETKHSIYAYQNEMIDKEISKIMISGADMLIMNLDEAVLEDRFGLPVEIISPSKNIPMTKEALDSYNAGTRNTSISALFGLALTMDKQKINLIPQELQIEKGVKERGKDLYRLGIYLVFILVTISSIFLGRIYNKERYLSRLRQEARRVQEKVDRLENMMDETRVMKKRFRTKNISLNLLYEIHRVISPEIYLMSISFDGENRLTLRGTSSSMSEIFKFINSLEDSRYFQNVNTKYATKHKVKGKELTDFEVICPLERTLERN